MNGITVDRVLVMNDWRAVLMAIMGFIIVLVLVVGGGAWTRKNVN